MQRLLLKQRLTPLKPQLQLRPPKKKLQPKLLPLLKLRKKQKKQKKRKHQKRRRPLPTQRLRKLLRRPKKLKINMKQLKRKLLLPPPPPKTTNQPLSSQLTKQLSQPNQLLTPKLQLLPKHMLTLLKPLK